MMAAALTLLDCGSADSEIYLYDTFDEVPLPGPHDGHFTGRDMREIYHEAIEDPIYDRYPLDRVAELMSKTGYPEANVHLIEGLVEQTIPDRAPDQVALCRLDTDFYESTAHEMEHLFPRIAEGGILVIDDYGDFSGARKAVDEYFERLERPPFLTRIDESCRLAVV